jgi:UDP-N-acetylmuramate-alanine ligase
MQEKGKIIVEGQSVGNKIGNGVANRIMSIKDIKNALIKFDGVGRRYDIYENISRRMLII